MGGCRNGAIAKAGEQGSTERGDTVADADTLEVGQADRAMLAACRRARATKGSQELKHTG